jgi:predicted short-subunit dehydrogenase-like oxidoreductase (DUF2520 family)
MTSARRIRIVGRGRAGSAFAAALAGRGWLVEDPVGRTDLGGAAEGVDLVLICVSDSAVRDVAEAIDPLPDVVVAHCSGSQGLDVVARHPRHGALHPLVSIPPPPLGADRLLDGAMFARAGDPLVDEVVTALGGHSFEVADADRAAYHAAAVIASNHLVVLMAQVERVAAAAGVELGAFRGLVDGTLDNVAALGPGEALTGPAARGDAETIAHHLAAIGPREAELYRVLSDGARRLAEDHRRT